MPVITIEPEKMQDVGENIKFLKQGSLVVLVIDTAKDIGPSKSGAMIGYGSTGGFAALPGGLKANVYVGKKA